MIDAKTLYWTAAFLNMAVIVACALLGVRNVRHGNVSTHRRLMLSAGVLVVVFLVSYLFKTRLLGHESLEVWATGYVWTLRLHETCVTVMLFAGGLALYLALRLRLASPERASQADPAWFYRRLRLHKRAGWTAIGAGVLGLLTAGVVLWGMYARLGVV